MDRIPNDMLQAIIARSGNGVTAPGALQLAQDLQETRDHADRLLNILLDLTHRFGQHPEGYEGPCECAVCRSHARPAPRF